MENAGQLLRDVVVFTILWLGVHIAPALAVICSTDANLAIPQDGSFVSIDIEMPPSPGTTITDLNFQLFIDHAWVGDVIATLTSPAGTTIDLINRPGVPASFFGCPRDDIDVTLDDAAATQAENQCSLPFPAVGGTRQPDGSLATFNGELVSGTWTLSVSDVFPADAGTIISANNCIDVSTTPVTISSFETKKRGEQLRAKWQTSSESFNLGFHLWGNVDGQWQQLNRRLITSKVVDSVAPQKYKHRLNMLKIDGDITQVGVSSVSTSGQEEFYGPFEIGERYGEETVPKYVDWNYQRALHDKAMQDAGYVKLRNRWVRNNLRREWRQRREEKRFPDTILEIESAAVYKVSYEDLLAQGIDLRGMPVHKMSLTRNGLATARSITNDNRRYKRRFGPGSEIVFYAHGPSEQDARYIANQPYLLSLDSANVIQLTDTRRAQQSRLAGDVTVSNTHIASENFGDKNLYSFGLEGDGWYDSSIRAIRRTGLKTIKLNVADDALLDQPVGINLELFGVTNFPRVDADGDGDLEPNHHYRVYLNRGDFPEAVAEGYADGREFIHVSQEVVGQLRVGDNEIQIELIPDNGHNLDLVYLVDGSLSYARPNTMISASLNFHESVDGAPTLLSTNGFDIDSVFAVDVDGNVAGRPFSGRGDTIQVNNAINPSQRGPTTLYFVSKVGYVSPAQVYPATQVSADELDLSETDYVVIADASLRGETLQRFVARQTQLGRRTKVVSSQSIFNQYSDGSPLPQAIADYLLEQSKASPFNYVLLVGGHTYNYRGYNTDETNRPINLIPSFYRGTEGITKQIPTAVPFVDFDKDGAPDKAIGRWPVRDLNQLKLIVDKTLAWHADGSHKDSQTALFIADAKDIQNNFTSSTHRLMSSLGLDLNPWQQTSHVLLDDVLADESIAADEKIVSARNAIIDGVNQGPALTVYSGHGAPGVWGRQVLISGSVSERFENSSAPTVIVPMACYTTYYETPNIKSLPEVLLTDAEGGAVAISGAALLSRSGDNERFGRALLEKMSVSGMDLGSAVLSVKQEMHKSSLSHQTIVYNWITLADPTLSFDLPKIEPVPELDQAPRSVP